ncbi:MAG: hypothetical protein Q4F49_03400 [Pseudoxanthomonas suwonensis]|nr:hypothetical protein [Pseudoxanthomonas suwonensis]
MLTLETLRSTLGWTAVINLALLSVVFFFWLAMRRTIHVLHRRWFDLEPAQIDGIVYAVMAGYKLGNLLLFVAPWMALHLLG